MPIKAVVFDAYGTLCDTHSVATVTEAAFPGHGDLITQIWRIKQLEYSWLRSLMRRYEDFAVVTRDALAYTLRILGLSCDAAKVFKPSPHAYALIETTLGIAPAEVLFVSSNPWDICGARSFGLTVAWIERVSPPAMAEACAKADLVAPITMFKALRTQMDELGFAPNYRIAALSELPEIVARA